MDNAEPLPRAAIDVDVAATSSQRATGQPPLSLPPTTDGDDFNSAEYRSSLYKRTNFRPEEREVLIELIEGYVDIIENRKGGYGPRDPNTNLMKDQVWQEIAMRFNDHVDFVKRDASQLRKCWMNMKARSQFTPSQRRRLGLDIGDRNRRRKAKRRPVGEGVRLLSFSNQRRSAGGRGASMFSHGRLVKTRPRSRQNRPPRDPHSVLTSRPTQLYSLLENHNYLTESRGNIVEFASGGEEPTPPVSVAMNPGPSAEVLPTARMQRVSKDGSALHVQRVISSPSSQVSYLAPELSLPRVEIHRPRGLRNSPQRITGNSVRRQTIEKVPPGIMQVHQYSEPTRQVNSMQYGFVRSEAARLRSDSTQTVSPNTAEVRLSPHRLEGSLRDRAPLKHVGEEVAHATHDEVGQRMLSKSGDGSAPTVNESVFVWEAVDGTTDSLPKITNVTSSFDDVKTKSEPIFVADDLPHESTEIHKPATTEAHTQTIPFSEDTGHGSLSDSSSKSEGTNATSDRIGTENMRRPDLEGDSTHAEDEGFGFHRDIDSHEQNGAEVRYSDEVLFVEEDGNENEDGFIGVNAEEGDEEDDADQEGDESHTQQGSMECDEGRQSRDYSYDAYLEEERKARMEILCFEVEKAKEEAKAAKLRRELLELELESARDQRDLQKRRQEAEIELIRERQRYERSRITELESSRKDKSRIVDTNNSVQENGLE